MKTIIYIIFILFPLSPALALNLPSIEVAFSPHRGAEAAIIKQINNAEKTIMVAAYNMTSRNISKALVKAYKRGVDVRIVLDRGNITEKYSTVEYLYNNGIPIRINYEYTIMHNKFIVVDNLTVETGSYNYTAAAENRNAENIIILKNFPDAAGHYSSRWRELWNESKEFKPS